jgi:HAD superfamily hydrolase (TIGR01509 family)
MKLQALLFDCDGVLAETERDGHRVAYNQAMTELGVPGEWSLEEYGELVQISGGKERLKYYFNKYPEKFPPDKVEADLIQDLYVKKTEIFKEMVGKGVLPPRSGISRLITEAHEKGVSLFICSTSHKESVGALVKRNYGEDCLNWFTELFCGDIVPRKKPAPDIYNLAKDKYGLDPAFCFVIEDSRNGLLAAKGAGMHCLVTQSFYTTEEDFSEADMVVSCLGDPGGETAKIIGNKRGKETINYITVMELDSLL